MAEVVLHLNSAFYSLGIDKWEPAAAAKTKAGGSLGERQYSIVHSFSNFEYNNFYAFSSFSDGQNLYLKN